MESTACIMAGVWSDISNFIGLQVSDKVPLDVFGEVVVFTAKLLYMAFAEDALSGSVCLLDVAFGMVFGHGYQPTPQGSEAVIRFISS